MSAAASILVRILAPKVSANCKSSASGRPAAMGFCCVLYECSPTNVAPAITLNPLSDANASNSTNAFHRHGYHTQQPAPPEHRKHERLSSAPMPGVPPSRHRRGRLSPSRCFQEFPICRPVESKVCPGNIGNARTANNRLAHLFRGMGRRKSNQTNCIYIHKSVSYIIMKQR